VRYYATDPQFIELAEKRLDRNVGALFLTTAAFLVTAGVCVMTDAIYQGWTAFGAAVLFGVWLSASVVRRAVKLRRLRASGKLDGLITVSDDTVTFVDYEMPWDDISAVHILDYRDDELRGPVDAGIISNLPVSIDVHTGDGWFGIDVEEMLSWESISRLIADLRVTAARHSIPVSTSRDPREHMQWVKAGPGAD